jgi:hypothetical protein
MPPKAGMKKKKVAKVTIPEGVDAVNVVSDYKKICIALNVDTNSEVPKVNRYYYLNELRAC